LFPFPVSWTLFENYRPVYTACKSGIWIFLSRNCPCQKLVRCAVRIAQEFSAEGRSGPDGSRSKRPRTARHWADRISGHGQTREAACHGNILRMAVLKRRECAVRWEEREDYVRGRLPLRCGTIWPEARGGGPSQPPTPFFSGPLTGQTFRRFLFIPSPMSLSGVSGKVPARSGMRQG
jgi:hypothetical protein